MARGEMTVGGHQFQMMDVPTFENRRTVEEVVKGGMGAVFEPDVLHGDLVTLEDSINAGWLRPG